MAPTSIYLARPIDYIDRQRNNQINQCAAAIRRAVEQHPEFVLYEPARAFTVGTSEAAESGFVNEVNTAALLGADVVIALWPHGSHSWGVPAEVAQAVAWDTPVHMIVTGPRSWAMPTPGVRLTYHTDKTLLGATMRMLSEFDLGEPRVEATPPGTQADRLQDEWDLQYKFVRPGELGDVPRKAYATDAGLDLFVSEDVLVPPLGFVDVPSNVAVALPPNTWGYLTGRSSTLRKKGLLVNPGVIDYGYTGELYSGVQNMTDQPVQLDAGTSIAQLIIIPMLPGTCRMQQVGELPDAPRGANGFGSSGN